VSPLSPLPPGLTPEDENSPSPFLTKWPLTLLLFPNLKFLDQSRTKKGKNEFARDKSVVQVVPPKESLSVSELEVSDQEEVVSEPESPGVGIDPDEDERVWFKHPKAVRKALRQNLWKASLLEKTPPKDSSILS
ncbi:hypothetical protein HID58_018941, partial [Brassica napus]